MEEAHPIPQNVTSFEFHLVGDMTLKQFGYLAAGLVSAYLTFVIFFPIAPIVAAPFIIIFAILGAAYAFVPILDRPLDHWTKAFFKAVYSPTRGNWRSQQNHKIKINPEDPIFKDRLKIYLANLKTSPKIVPTPEEKPAELALNINSTNQLANDLSSKPLTNLAEQSKKMTEPIKMNLSSFKSGTSSPLTQDSRIKLTKEGVIQPHIVEPIKSSQPVLKPLKTTPENNLPSQTLQSVKQSVENQNKSSTTPFGHENFTSTNFPAFNESQLDFSPQHNPAYQHLQFVYEAPVLRNQPIKNLSIPATISPTQSVGTNINSTPRIEFNQPNGLEPSSKPQPNVNSLFTTVSLPNQTVKQNPLTPPTHQPLPPKTELPIHPVLETHSKTVTTPPTIDPKTDINPSPSLPSSEELNKLVELAKEARTLQVKLGEAEKRIREITVNATNPEVTKPISAERFDQVYSKLQNLITQTDSLNKEAVEVHKVIPPTIKPSTVKIVEPIKTQTTQPILTSQPNVINGIVTDNVGNYLEGVIIIIHDKDNLPVRALKTNKIGQFTGTTPLPGGVYTITLEKDHLDFDTLEVNLNGEIIPPLQVSAKAGGVAAHA